MDIARRIFFEKIVGPRFSNTNFAVDGTYHKTEYASSKLWTPTKRKGRRRIRSSAYSRGMGSPLEMPPSAEAFLLQYTACEERLFAYLMTLLGNRTDAEEIYQETSLVLWRNFHEFQPGTNFFNWAKRIAFHRVLALRKKRQHQDVPGSEAFLNSVQSVLMTQSQQLSDRLRALGQCVEKLSESDRQLVASRYELNRSIKDLAEQRGCPANTLYKALKRIRQALVECIDRSLAREAHW